MVFLAQFSVWAAGGMFFARTFTGFFFVFRQVTRRVFEKILFFSVLLLFFRKIFKIISQILMPKSSCQKNLAQEQFSELFLMQFCNFCLSMRSKPNNFGSKSTREQHVESFSFYLLLFDFLLSKISLSLFSVDHLIAQL